MKVLRMGDPHVKVNNIEEMEKLMHWLVDYLMANPVDRLEILGDLFHTHAVIRMEVLDFWDAWLDTLSEMVEVIVLVGNHDMTGDNDDSLNALNIFNRMKKNNLKIISSVRVEGIYAYIPYTHDGERFIGLANGLASTGAKVLVCHQTFGGAKYESGIYAPDGIDPTRINFEYIISGHIHSRQRFGKVIYPGTAKWDTLSDANEPKGFWLVRHDDESGAILDECFIDTSTIVTPILRFSWKEGENCPVIPEGSKSTIELIGTSDWIAAQKAKLKGKVSITSKITDKSKLHTRKTGNSLEQFVLNHFEPTTGVDRKEVFNYMKELSLV